MRPCEKDGTAFSTTAITLCGRPNSISRSRPTCPPFVARANARPCRIHTLRTLLPFSSHNPTVEFVYPDEFYLTKIAEKVCATGHFFCRRAFRLTQSRTKRSCATKGVGKQSLVGVSSQFTTDRRAKVASLKSTAPSDRPHWPMSLLTSPHEALRAVLPIGRI